MKRNTMHILVPQMPNRVPQNCGGFANTLLATPSSKWNEMNVKKAEGKITARFDFEPRGD